MGLRVYGFNSAGKQGFLQLPVDCWLMFKDGGKVGFNSDGSKPGSGYR